MDGLDTLSQVALADQLNLSFALYNPPATTTSSAGPVTSSPSASVAAAAEPIPSARGLLEDVDNLNTPVTNSSDVNFNFVNSEFELSQEALPIPITGESSLQH